MGPGSDRRDRWRQVQSLFHRARELALDERAAFLERHCAGDPALLAEVSELLADALPDDSVDDGPERGPREDLSGRTLGHYELLRIIGEGSMGVIYEARQRRVERSVALKILRPRGEVLRDGGTNEACERMARRFGAEAEVLGLLDHPGIVPIHELDREDGRSYFTMRLVRGDDFRDIIARVHAGPDASGGWTLQRALGVVLRVCETMAFAHDRGVLHRDLKPSHVMVGDFGEVYIVDWGLARLPGRPEERDLRLRAEAEGPAAGSLVPAPLRTVEGDVIGTPAYMPPEQARGELGRLGARSDVYAVGAMLYHLLVGRPPYVGADEPAVSAQRVLERVRLGAPAPLATLAPALPPALVAICDKAMRREPEERYPDMEALSHDLRAFLENRVVTAHRTGTLAELGKWLQRNQLIAAAFALALLIGVGWAWSVAHKNRALAAAVEEARIERDFAATEAAYSDATTEFLVEVFRTVHPKQAQGEEVTVRDALDLAAARVEDSDAPPRVRAQIRRTLGVAYFHLGHYDLAEPHLAYAAEVLTRTFGEEHANAFGTVGEHGSVLLALGRHGEAEASLRRSLELSRRVRGERAPLTLRAMGHLAQLLQEAGQPEEALALAERLEELQLAAGGPEHPELHITYETLGSIHDDLEDFAAAEHWFRRELDQTRRLFGEGHSSTLIAAQNLANALSSLGRHEEALELSLEAVGRVIEIFGPHHRNALVGQGNLALYLIDAGAPDDGLALLRETIATQREVCGPAHPDTVQSIFNLAKILRTGQRWAEALPLYRELHALHRADWNPAERDVRLTLIGLADCLMHEGRLEEAVPVLRTLLPLHERYPEGIEATREDTARQLALCLEALGR